MPVFPVTKYRLAAVAACALLIAGAATADYATDGLVGYWSLETISTT